jgi:hypothetical protein
MTPAASQARVGHTLEVKSVTLTNRLTLVTLGMVDLPTGVSFSQVLR